MCHLYHPHVLFHVYKREDTPRNHPRKWIVYYLRPALHKVLTPNERSIMADTDRLVGWYVSNSQKKRQIRVPIQTPIRVIWLYTWKGGVLGGVTREGKRGVSVNSDGFTLRDLTYNNPPYSHHHNQKKKPYIIYFFEILTGLT